MAETGALGGSVCYFFLFLRAFIYKKAVYVGVVVFPECVAKGSRLTWESEGRAVFARRCFRVRNRPQPSSTVLKCSNPAPMALPLGRALKRDFSWTCHVSVCAAIPL